MVRATSAAAALLALGALMWVASLWLLSYSSTETARKGSARAFRLPEHSAAHVSRGRYYFTNPSKSKMGAFLSERGFLPTTDIRAASLIWFQSKQIKKVWGSKRRARMARGRASTT